MDQHGEVSSSERWARPPTPADADHIMRIVNACTLQDVGMASYAAADVAKLLDVSPDELAAKYRLLGEGERAIAWVEVDPSDDFFEGFVEPAHQGRGFGTAVVGTAEELLRAAGRTKAVVNVGSERGCRFIESLGYRFVHGEHAMVYDVTEPPPAVVAPPGISIQPFTEGADERALFDAMRTGFGDDWPAESEFDGWIAAHQQIDNYDPALWWLARVGDDVVGALQARPRWGAQDDHGWVKNIAVLPGGRKQGLGRALLFTAFHAFHQRGKRWVVLGVDADNPTKAPDFYLRIGMQVRGHSWDYERAL